MQAKRSFNHDEDIKPILIKHILFFILYLFLFWNVMIHISGVIKGAEYD